MTTSPRVLWIGIGLLALLASPRAAARVEVRSDPGADFTRYATYEILEADVPRVPELRDYMVGRLDDHLRQAGLRRVESDGDLVVEIHVESSVGGGLTGLYLTSVTWGFSVLTTDVRQFTEGTIVVAIIDRAEKRGIWQAVATAVVQGNDYRVIRRKIDKITRKMFRGFPPER